MTSSIKPLDGKVLLKRIIKEQKKGALVLPDSASQETQFYEVMAIGPAGKDQFGNVREIHFALGNHVILAKYAALPILLDKSEFFIVRFEDIIATVIKPH